MRRLPQSFWWGIGVLGALVLMAVMSGRLPLDPNTIDFDRKLRTPCAEHWFGTDTLGRDVAAQVVHGARVSLGVGLLSAVFSLLIGLPMGALAGYRGGWSDAVVSRTIEAVLCLPTLLLVLAFFAAAPGWFRALPGELRMALVIGATGWMPTARYLRGEFMKLRRSVMVEAAEALGGSPGRVILRHILPSALAPVLVTSAFAVAAAIGLEAALSFLGIGVRLDAPSWGRMLADARELVDRAWWLAFFPGAALFLAVLACNLIGEGLRDALDPRSRPGGR